MSAASHERAARLGKDRVALFATLAALWIACAWFLRKIWSFEMERYYGFTVFPLAAYLLSVRGVNRPEASVSPAGRSGGWIAAGLVGTLLLGGAGLVLTANALWTTAAWLACVGAIVASLGVIGGSLGSAAARAAMFPLGFTLTALPWPSALEVPVVAWLRAANATWAATLVSWSGWPAVAHGNVIETGAGFVGVQEACSGIVGLQTAAMVALFFGELRNLSAFRRSLLVIGAAVIALLANLARSAWLTWTAASRGAGAIHALHDTAAAIELCSSIVAVVLLALWLRAGALPNQPLIGWSVRAAGTRSNALVLTTLGFSIIGIGWWYCQPLVGAKARAARWSLERPDSEWKRMRLPAGTERILHYDSAVNLAWRDASVGRDWIALLLNWDSDPTLRYATLHTPEICLPGAGASLEAKLGRVSLNLAGRALDFHAARFRAGGETFHTFSCVWDAERGESIDAEADAAAFDMLHGRLAMVREGRRQLGLEQITFVLNRCRDDAEAFGQIRQMVPRLLHVQTAAGR